MMFPTFGNVLIVNSCKKESIETHLQEEGSSLNLEHSEKDLASYKPPLITYCKVHMMNRHSDKIEEMYISDKMLQDTIVSGVWYLLEI